MSSDQPSPFTETPELFKWPDGAEVKTYKGNCHCRKFSYEVDHPALDVQKPMRCDCTYCMKTGTINIFGPEKILRFDDNSASRDELSKFRAKICPTEHHFCPGCGCYLFWQGMGFVGINVRMFDGIEVDKLETGFVNNRDL